MMEFNGNLKRSIQIGYNCENLSTSLALLSNSVWWSNVQTLIAAYCHYIYISHSSVSIEATPLYHRFVFVSSTNICFGN